MKKSAAINKVENKLADFLLSEYNDVDTVASYWKQISGVTHGSRVIAGHV